MNCTQCKNKVINYFLFCYPITKLAKEPDDLVFCTRECACKWVNGMLFMVVT